MNQNFDTVYNLLPHSTIDDRIQGELISSSEVASFDQALQSVEYASMNKDKQQSTLSGNGSTKNQRSKLHKN